MSTAEVISISGKLTGAERAAAELAEMLAQPDTVQVSVNVSDPWFNRELPGPGIYRDMSMPEYLALPYVGASRLEKMRRSALQYRYAPAREEKRGDERDLGSAVHLAILEPGRFENFYIVLGQCDGKTKKGERCGNGASVYRETGHFCGIHDPHKGQPLPSHVSVISREDYDATIGMRDAVLSHPRARSLFEGKGDFEVTIIFDDRESGLRCKIRPDRLIERSGSLVDIKTSFNASPTAFPVQAERLGYWRKIAFYRSGLRALGWPYDNTSLLAIESAFPFDLTPFLCDEQDVDSAEAEVEQLLNVLASCQDTNTWPGYASDFVVLNRPAWVRGAGVDD